jgi:hypothetical protein
VNVRLSCPSKLRGELVVSGTTVVTVHKTLSGESSSRTGTFPRNVVSSGFQSPQTGSLSRVHTTSVPLKAPSASDVSGVHVDYAKVID